MKKIIILSAILLTCSALRAQNSIKNVIVETYYISDGNDATDTLGGFLEAGSKTYRVYIQLQPGCKLQKIYGDNNHALIIKSTENFFNNLDRGKSFAKDINKSSYQNNTAALDTWFTLGQTTKTSGKTYFGILKSDDADDSFIGGLNNDGGSSAISGGLLTNNDPAAGIPVTISDGMSSMTDIPNNWFDNGFFDLVTGIDSTIFGSVKIGREFISHTAYLQNSGVMGVIPESNTILVAQLTTKGDISFDLNIEVKEVDGTITKYVSSGKDTLNEKFNPYLKYPPECGCLDPAYMEYNDHYACNNPDSCKTRIVLGCMDPNACNYDPNANYNVQSLCCYPGMCADRDISLVCPNLGVEYRTKIKLYPNPAHDEIKLEAELKDNAVTKFVVYNSFGNIELERNLGLSSGVINHNIDLSNLTPGIYLIRFYTDNSVVSDTFIKN